MDRPRPNASQERRRRGLLWAGLGLAALVGATLGLSRLPSAAPTIDREQVRIGVVTRGEMLCQVRGNGTLVPEEILWIPTMNAGRVERIRVLPGAAVQAETVLVELSNPEVEKAEFDAQWQLKAAEAELTNLVAQLAAQRLAQQAAVASAQAQCTNAQLDAEINEQLARDQLVAQLTLKQSCVKAEETAKLLEIEKERLQISAEAARAQRAVQEAKVEQLRALRQLRRRQLESLQIRAGIEGVLQKLGDDLPLKVGQQLAAGASVACVANPARLKAEIKIYETQAKDIQHGQPATVDTRNGVVRGRVVRIDPAVQNGTVTVDVALEGPLPNGARPDLSVEGTIELERLPDVLHVGKPVNVSPETTAGLFKLQPNGKEAVRVPVRLGRGSVDTMEIREGLEAGEQVVLSDMSTWDAHDRIRLR